VRLNRRQYARLCVVICLLGTTLCYGAIRVSSARFDDGPRLALLQSNIEQKHKNTGNDKVILDQFTELINGALARRERPDLIVWPETAYPYGYITVDPAVTAAALEKQVRSFAPKFSGKEWLVRMADIANHLRSWTDRAGVPMLVGVTRYEHLAGRD